MYIFRYGGISRCVDVVAVAVAVWLAVGLAVRVEAITHYLQLHRMLRALDGTGS